jgi:O-antigen ligase
LSDSSSIARAADRRSFSSELRLDSVVPRRYLPLGALAVLAAANAGLGALLANAQTKAITLAVLPVALVAIGSLIASNRAILIFAAIAIDLLDPLPLTGALPLHAGIEVYPSDILVLLAVASWVAAWLVNPEHRPSSLRTRILGWPLLLFGIMLFAGVVRGHERYGENLVGIPLRLLLYAGIAAAVTDLKPRDAYRGLVALFYAGTVWQVLVALYGYATGTSAQSQDLLSTGGVRVVAGSTAMFMAGALLLALLNVERASTAKNSALHLIMAGLATFALAGTLQRTTFAIVGLLVPLSFLVFRRIGFRAAVLLPLFAPFVVLVALLVPQGDSSFFPTLAHRVTASPSTDTSVTWRRKAYAAVWSQVQESPITGIGFGRPASFVTSNGRTRVGQDPHNQFLYLWAGGGLLLVGSFVLLLLVYTIEVWRRFRNATQDERYLLFWAASLWFVFVVNSLTGIVLTQPNLLLPFWILMVLPMVVRPAEKVRVSGIAGYSRP